MVTLAEASLRSVLPNGALLVHDKQQELDNQRAALHELQEAYQLNSVAIPLATLGNVERRIVAVSEGELTRLVNQTVVTQINDAIATDTVFTDTALKTTAGTNNVVWRWWNEERLIWTATGTSSMHHDAWNGWCQAASGSTTNSLVWEAWVSNGVRYQKARAENEFYHQRWPVPTPEQLAVQQAARDKAEIDRKARVAEIETAKGRAEKLLLSALTDQQKEEFKSKGHFHCKSKQGNIYRIYRGTHGNVKKLDPSGRKEIESLCIQPENVPEADAMLAQKFHIEFNEESFRKTANITRLTN